MVPRNPPPASTALCSALLAVLALGQAGCGPTSNGDGSGGGSNDRARQGLPADALVIGTVQDMETVNELISANSGFNDDIVDRLFLQLLAEQPDYDQHPPTFAPQLADSYEFSDDNLTLTMHLREDATWSDGVAITAEDVRWTWLAQTDEEVAWDWSFAKASITDVEVIEPKSVRFHFSESSSSQLLDANEGVILPKHVWSKLPFAEWRSNANWFLDNLVTSGPYTLGRWQRQQYIELGRNEHYFDPEFPRVARVIFRIIPEQSQLLAELLSGRLDMIRNVEVADTPRLEENANTKLYTFPARQYNFVCWNTRRPQLSEPEVRRGLALATDRQAIVDVILRGYARVGSSPVLSGVWAHNPEVQPWPHDPEAAVAIFERHGWIDTNGDGIRERDGVPFRIELLTNPGNRAREDASLMLQDQLRKVGIDVRPRRMELDTIIRLGMAHDFDAILSAFVIDTSLDLEYGFHTQAIDEGSNWASYSNPEVDRLIEEVNRQIEPELAKPHLFRIQEILHQEQPLLILWEPPRLVATTIHIENVEPSPLGDFVNLHEWSFRQP